MGANTHYSLVLLPRGEIKEGPKSLIPETLQALILCTPDSIMKASDFATVTIVIPLLVYLKRGFRNYKTIMIVRETA